MSSSALSPGSARDRDRDRHRARALLELGSMHPERAAAFERASARRRQSSRRERETEADNQELSQRTRRAGSTSLAQSSRSFIRTERVSSHDRGQESIPGLPQLHEPIHVLRPPSSNARLALESHLTRELTADRASARRDSNQADRTTVQSLGSPLRAFVGRTENLLNRLGRDDSIQETEGDQESASQQTEVLSSIDPLEPTQVGRDETVTAGNDTLTTRGLDSRLSRSTTLGTLSISNAADPTRQGQAFDPSTSNSNPTLQAGDLAILRQLYERMNAQEEALERHSRNEGTVSLEELRWTSEQLVREANAEFARIGRATTAAQRLQLDRETQITIRRAQRQQEALQSRQNPDNDQGLRRRNRIDRLYSTREVDERGPEAGPPENTSTRPRNSTSSSLLSGNISTARIFPTKPVYELYCADCGQLICARAMKAMLLADTNVTLFSTDLPPPNVCRLGTPDYQTDRCECKLFDMGCQTCGNTVGYHIQSPCKWCIVSCNNGHFFMMHSSKVLFKERQSRINASAKSGIDENVVEPASMMWRELPDVMQDAREGLLGNPFHWLSEDYGPWWRKLVVGHHTSAPQPQSNAALPRTNRNSNESRSSRETGRQWWERSQISSLRRRPEEPDEVEDTARRLARRSRPIAESPHTLSDTPSSFQYWRQYFRSRRQLARPEPLPPGTENEQMPFTRSDQLGNADDGALDDQSPRTYAEVVRALGGRRPLPATENSTRWHARQSRPEERLSTSYSESSSTLRSTDDDNDDATPSTFENSSGNLRYEALLPDEELDHWQSFLFQRASETRNEHMRTYPQVLDGNHDDDNAANVLTAADPCAAESIFDRFCSHENLCRAYKSSRTTTEDAWRLVLTEGAETILFCINFVWPVVRGRPSVLTDLAPAPNSASSSSSSLSAPPSHTLPAWHRRGNTISESLNPREGFSPKHVGMRALLGR